MKRAAKRIGIFGGSFDPPHLGHLVIAELACRELKLDVVYLVPAYLPPHKIGISQTTPADRLAMTRLAVRNVRQLAVSDAELRRKGVSYTVDTVRTFRRRFPKAELFLIIGSDSLMQFHSWKSPQRILKEVSLAVYRRPGWARHKTKHAAGEVLWLHGPIMRVSSTEIRSRVARGKPIHDLVRRNVSDFIMRRGLYRPKESPR